ncbi:MAG: T9SS type A sorting domain-containing protein, partial [Candidatus Omnitrophica bacterium]|nr:T9SS type A sorting domain-containing protein [Candidatus Omnitrophota bacterium]
SIYRLESNILPKSVIYVKQNDKFIGSAFADTNGYYKIVLPAGNFKVYVNRLGYSSDSSNITINPPGGNLDSVNFYLQKVTSGINPPVVTRVYYYLGQNYPNPFNPATIIQYVLGSTTLVRLTVYDISGRKIKELENTEKGPGTHTVEFDGKNLPSGVYFYKIETENYSATKSMVLIK